jgi:hypothetical protein
MPASRILCCGSIAALLIVSCTSSSTPDATADVSGDATGICASPLEGPGPFGATLSGSGTFTADAGAGAIRDQLTATVYFPEGRVAGAPVIFAMDEEWPRDTVSESRGTLGADLSAGPFVIGSYRDRVTASLGAGTSGIHAHVTRNFAMASDVYEFFDTEIDLCPTGAPPDPVVTVSATHLAPTSPIQLGVTVPPGVMSPALAARAGDVDVPLADGSLHAMRAIPRAAWPPGVAISIDTSSWRDVLGRPYTASPVPSPLVAIQPLVDRAFDTMPPAASAAFDGVTPTLESGVLRMQVESFDSHPFAALFALGAPPAGTSRVVVRIGVSNLGSRIAIVGADGSASPIVAAGPMPADVSASIPAAGALWLSIADPAHPQDPMRQSLPPPREAILLDEVRFE